MIDLTTMSRCSAANSRAMRGKVVTRVGGTANPLWCATRNCQGLSRAWAAACGWFIQRAVVEYSMPKNACADSAVSHAEGLGAWAALAPGRRTHIERSPSMLNRRPPADRWPRKSPLTYSADIDASPGRSAGSKRTSGVPRPCSSATTMSAVTSCSAVRISTVIG